MVIVSYYWRISKKDWRRYFKKLKLFLYLKLIGRPTFLEPSNLYYKDFDYFQGFISRFIPSTPISLINVNVFSPKLLHIYLLSKIFHRCSHTNPWEPRGGEIAQSLAFLFTKWEIWVRARLDPLVLERWNSITVLLTCSHQCRLLVKKGSPCFIMSV